MDLDPTRTYDVTIAGAGLAGGSLALRLARAGAKVALVDAATFPRDKLCGEFLSPESWGVIDRLGLADEIERVGYHPIRRVRVTTPRGRQIDAEFAPVGLPPGIGLRRSTLDSLLLAKAREAGAEVIEGARVGGPIVERGRVVGLLGRRRDVGRIEVRSRVVVAADGRHSRLVEETGQVRPVSLRRPRLFGLKRHVAVAEPEAAEPEGTVGLHLITGGYVGTCLVEGRVTNLCGLLPETLARRSRGDLDGLAAEQFAVNPTLASIWDSSIPVAPWKTVSGVRVETAAPRLPGIFYAGDCRGTVDPLGGQGMTMALLGAEVLTPHVLKALVAKTDGRAIQRDYHRAWRARFQRRVNLCRAFHHALVNPGLVDLVSHLGGAGGLLARCFDWTRDRVG